MISYHFAGKDDLIKVVVLEVVESAKACMAAAVALESLSELSMSTGYPSW